MSSSAVYPHHVPVLMTLVQGRRKVTEKVRLKVGGFLFCFVKFWFGIVRIWTRYTQNAFCDWALWPRFKADNWEVCVCVCGLAKNVSVSFSAHHYSPNPGGGPAAGVKVGSEVRSRSTTCKCPRSEFPVLDPVCPFHGHKTSGSVKENHHNGFFLDVDCLNWGFFCFVLFLAVEMLLWTFWSGFVWHAVNFVCSIVGFWFIGTFFVCLALDWT